MRTPTLLRGFTSFTLALTAIASPPAKTPALTVAGSASMPAPNPSALPAIPNRTSRAELLAPGKTQGTFHLNGVVDTHKTVILRWANDRGEMPTEGVVISRQKVGDTSWKELNARHPVAFFKTDGLESRLRKLPQEKREGLYSMAFSSLSRDPATGRRQALAAAPPKGAPASFSDVKPAKVTDQFRTLRASGRLGVGDLQMLNSHADLDPDAADAYGLVYRDQPGSGAWRYKIRVMLPEGGAVEVVCPKTFDPSMPTPIPPPATVTAQSANGGVLLNWKAAPADTIAGYNIYRAADPKGPYRRINATPVKMVALTAEDPEITLARATARGAVIARETKKVPAAQLTPAKVAEIRAMAADSVASGPLPALSAERSQAIKSAVASGSLHAGGAVKALSLYTDSIRAEGNGDLVNDRTYLYKVVSVDIGGAEGPMEALTPVPGTPKDLQPPQVPGRPGLAGAAEATLKLRTAQAQRLKDPKLTELDQAVRAKAPGASLGLSPAGQQLALQPALPPAALRPEVASLSLGQAKQMKLSRTVATMPIKELAAVAEASVLRSLPDGTAPKASLVWTPSGDADLKSYTVYRASGKGPMTALAVTATPSWEDATLEVGKAYTYAVTATDQMGNESIKSPEWVLQVCDSALKTKLALKGIQGKVSTGPAPAGPGRRFLRPSDRILATTGLERLSTVKAALKLPPAASSSLVSTYSEPKAGTARSVRNAALVQGMAPAAQPSASPATPLAKPLEVRPDAIRDLKVSTHVTALRALPARSFNPMLTAALKPDEIHVQLTWTRPLDGYPMEYTVLEAPQNVRVVSTPRSPVRIVPANLSLVHASGKTAALPTAPVKPALPVAAKTPSSGPAPSLGMVQSTPELHASAARLMLPAAASAATARRELLASTEVLTGPGAFALITPTPLATESFVVTFPADAAQYGGATFYFQIQAHTREFGRLVDGPISEPIEVRLPDIVPPPIPEPGSLDMHENGAGSIDVNLLWTQAAAPDLAGAFVERQPMAYKLVDGIAQATGSQGPVARLNPTPAPGLTFRDPAVPAGFYRYTLRSVDKTGNESAVRGSLEVLVPGEPLPDPPQGVVLSGDHLTWQPAKNAAGYSVWRSFTGTDGDFDCISPILGATATSFDLPPQKKVFLKVVSRSASGMYQAPSDAVTHP
jgi:fibronectin type 3 domain-containing protein